MVKKLSALATVTAAALASMSALGTGCSTTTTTTEEPVVDSGPTVRPRPDAAEEDAGPQVCPTTDPIPAADLPWRPPTPLKGDCSQADYKALDDYLTANTSATVSQVDAFLKNRSQVCHDCVFTDANATTWGPIPTAGGNLVTINIGSCFALLSGKEAAGKSIQNLFDCELVACADCATQAEYDACSKKADQGACKAILTQAQKDFGGVPDTIFDQCGSFMDSVRVQCVAPADAAGDAGDAGDDASDASDDAADAADGD
jgi:hypothetical protein